MKTKDYLLILLFVIVVLFILPLLWNFVSPFAALGGLLLTIYLTFKKLKLLN